MGTSDIMVDCNKGGWILMVKQYLQNVESAVVWPFLTCLSINFIVHSLSDMGAVVNADYIFRSIIPITGGK